MHYHDRIKKLIPDLDPRHIEAYMRCQFGTLDGLDQAQFSAGARIAAACVDEGGTAAAEALARSYGL